VNVYPGARYFQNPNYGFPTVGAPRRVKPTILGVVHIADSMSSAESQTRWAFGANKSWTFMLDRDGSVVQSLDPVTQTPWTNGVVTAPDTSNPLIAAAVGSSYNLNEACFLTIENVGIPFSDPITPAQEATMRGILAWGSRLSGIPINRRTVIGHYQIDGLNRRNCPVVPVQRDGLFARLLSGELPVSEDDAMLEWVRKAKPESYAATLPAGTNVRYAPKITDDTLALTLPADLRIAVIGRVWGQEHPAGSDNHYWLAFIHPDAGLVVVHSSQITERASTTAEADRLADQANIRAGLIKDEALKALVGTAIFAQNKANPIKEM
jgi:hypothetical protein